MGAVFFFSCEQQKSIGVSKTWGSRRFKFSNVIYFLTLQKFERFIKNGSLRTKLGLSGLYGTEMIKHEAKSPFHLFKVIFPSFPHTLTSLNQLVFIIHKTWINKG